MIFNIDEEFEENLYEDSKDSLYEEDSENFNDISSEESTIVTSGGLKCSNDSIITMESYTEEDDPIQIFLLNSTGKFEKSTCITVDELKQMLSSNMNTTTPSNIMSIYTKPKEVNTTGIGANATGRIVIKLPPNNIYVTYGSLKRIMKSTTNMVWYALPLFGGKRRRIGNLDEAIISGSNHGQIPGFVVYKLYTKDEIRNGVIVKEQSDDYPFGNIYKQVLYTLIGEEVSKEFVNRLIYSIISKYGDFVPIVNDFEEESYEEDSLEYEDYNEHYDDDNNDEDEYDDEYDDPRLRA
jgi:hypothetical protein